MLISLASELQGLLAFLIAAVVQEGVLLQPVWAVADADGQPGVRLIEKLRGIGTFGSLGVLTPDPPFRLTVQALYLLERAAELFDLLF